MVYSKNTINFQQPHRHSQAPVRFYKIVSITFLLITLVLLGVIIFMSSKRAKIIIKTKSDPIEANFSIKVGKVARNQDVYVSGQVISKVFDVDSDFEPKANKTEEGVATGKVIIYNKTNQVQALIPKTRLLSPEGVLFRLKTRVSLPPNSEVEAEVYADKPGGESDIEPTKFTIPGLSSALQKVIYAESKEKMIGGLKKIGYLNQTDIEEATEILKQKTIEAYEQEIEKKYTDLDYLIKIVDVNLQSDKELGEEVDNFKLTGQIKLIAVLYNKDELEKYAQEKLKKQVVDNNEELKSIEDNPNIELIDYNLERNTATFNVILKGRVSLDANSPDLDKLKFFGKNREEIKRQVMSLKHVQGVEVEFKPFWNQHVPYIATHIDIVVREIQ